MLKKLFISLALFTASGIAYSGQEAFSKGPQIQHFGENAKVDNQLSTPENFVFKVRWDVGKPGADGQLNRSFNSLARFINMHVANGVKPENLQLALVVHGKAAFDLLSNQARQEKQQQSNINAPLLKALLENNVRIYLCGQTAAYYGIKNGDLYPGVKMALSAMTAHAILDKEAYSLNPF